MDNELANALGIQLGDKPMPVPQFAGQGKKQRHRRSRHRATVEKQVFHTRVGFGLLKPGGLEDLLDVGEGVSHAAKFVIPDGIFLRNKEIGKKKAGR